MAESERKGTEVRVDEQVVEVRVGSSLSPSESLAQLRLFLTAIRKRFADALGQPFTSAWYDQVDQMARTYAGQDIADVLREPLYESQLPLVIERYQRLLNLLRQMEEWVVPSEKGGSDGKLQ